MIEYIFSGTIGGLVVISGLYLVTTIKEWIYSRNRKIMNELKEEIRCQSNSTRGV